MRRGKLILLLMIAVLPGFCSGETRVIKSDSQGLVLAFDFPEPVFRTTEADGAVYTGIRLAGCPLLTEIGKPELPVKGEMFLLPPNTVPQLLDVKASSGTDYRMVPVPARGAFVQSSALPDPAVYRGREFFPQKEVLLTGPARTGESKVAFVSVRPMRYDPVSGLVRFHKRLIVTIGFKAASLGDTPKAGKSAFSTASLAAGQTINREKANDWTSLAPAPVSKTSEVWADTFPYKLLVEREGIYNINYQDLLQAGINPAGYDPRSFKLYSRGIEIPLYFKGQADGFFDPEDYFEFYGQVLNGDSSYYHPYSRDNVYWLGLGGSFGARMIEEDGAPTGQPYPVPLSFPSRVHLESDSLFYRLNSPYSDQNDRWYWRRVDEHDSTIVNIDLPDLDGSSPESTSLTIQFHGYTDLILGTSDHWAIASLNGLSVSNNIRWDGQAPLHFETKLPPGQLVPGNNRLVLKHGPLDTIDSYFLNWVEVEYPRRYSVSSGELTFKAPALYQDSLALFRLTGLESQAVDIYKLGVSRMAGIKVGRDPNGVSYQAEFEDRPTDRSTYYAVPDDGRHKLKPKAIIRNNIPVPALDDPVNSAQYLVIAPEEYLEEATRLAGQRAAGFNGVRVVSVSDICDAFNHGIYQDRPIRDFIRKAWQNWKVPPSYILLLGGGSWDPRNLRGHSARDLVPVHLTRTNSFGPAADDNYYACLTDGDILPDIAVGRVPVVSKDDYRVWQAKQESYEQNPFLDQWQRDFMLIAGRENNASEDFRASSDALAVSLDPSFTYSKVYHSSPATTQDLIDQFREGSVMAGYYGHGGGQVLSHDSFFRIDEATRLDNWGRWPFFGSFTCYSGAFDIPDTITISQALLYKTFGGAIGVYSNSGPSWWNVMEQTFIQAADKQGLERFGDITVSSKYGMAAAYGTSSGEPGEMISSYNLLGDPGMRLAIAQRGIVVVPSPASVLPGDTIDITVTGSFGPGNLSLLSLQNPDGATASSAVATSDSAGWCGGEILVPQAIDSGKALIRAFVKDADSSWAGYSIIGVSQPAFYNITALPARPVNMVDSIDIISGAADPGGIDSVWCEWQVGWPGDTLSPTASPMDSSSPGTYRLRSKLGPMGPADTVALNFRICLSGPSTVRAVSAWLRHQINTRPDLTPVDNNNQHHVHFGGKRVLTLSAELFNLGETTARNIPVRFYRYNDGLPPLDSAEAVIDSLVPGGRYMASVPWLPPAETDRIYLAIDPDSSCQPPDQNQANNRFSWTYVDIPPDQRTYYQLGSLGSGDTVNSARFPVSFYLPDSSLNDSAVAVIGEITIDGNSPLLPSKQPGLRPLGDTPPWGAYLVAITDSSRALLKGRKLWLSQTSPWLASAPDPDLVNLYRYNYRQSMWQKVPGAADTARVWGETESLGVFMPLVGSDSNGPTITARVDQQATGSGRTIIVARPQYSVLIEDGNGINLDSIWVVKDGQPVSRGEFNLPSQPQDPNSVPLTYSPYLADGDHLLVFGACDNLGNRSSIQVESKVSAVFGLHELACYPNPIDGQFADIYFLVGDRADGYKLRIYTVAGRLVRTITGGYVSGTKTVRWNLDDDRGMKVANGVYFYTLEIWAGEKNEKKTSKLAVLR